MSLKKNSQKYSSLYLPPLEKRFSPLKKDFPSLKKRGQGRFVGSQRGFGDKRGIFGPGEICRE
ncbi:MAG: hypothetical protein COT16_03240 [Elusimicrobia bacterium CG08_land_8_20_14_0_20_44_26]|nr:MAG: hypothetical protein COT16_03240 [Elusimicrobia bacterium CG08_land_8_20_14_0_20_44_26]